MSESIGLIKKRPEVDLRKSTHVGLLPDTHATIRVMCVRLGISMQEFFEEMAQRAAADDPTIMKIVAELVESKKKRYYKQLSLTDAESLFDIIAHESPLK